MEGKLEWTRINLRGKDRRELERTRINLRGKDRRELEWTGMSPRVEDERETRAEWNVYKRTEGKLWWNE
jgi:hypothetical protein